MDRMINVKFKEVFSKYKYVLLVLVLGMFLMAMPERKAQVSQQTTPTPVSHPTTKTEELEAILGQIEGVGKVRVMLTEAAGAETIYQTDEDRSTASDNENVRIETVIITDSSRGEAGLVRTVTPPTYLGAIIVCQGGGSSTVRLSVVDAVSDVTGISTDRITVLKMK